MSDDDIGKTLIVDIGKTVIVPRPVDRADGRAGDATMIVPPREESLPEAVPVVAPSDVPEPEPTTVVSPRDASEPPPTTVVSPIEVPEPATAVGSSRDVSEPEPTTVVESSVLPATTVVGSGGVGVGLEWVPPAVFTRFPDLHQSSYSGAEAVVLTGDVKPYGPIAVKVYRQGLRSDPAVVEILKTSAEHDHVVTLHEALMIDGCWVEVLERIDHGSLTDLAGGQPLRGDRLRQVVEELANAIAHMHDLGLVHRDIKPTNVLVRSDDADGLDLVLADFGLCAIQSSDLDLQAQNRSIMYASPETQAGLMGAEGDWWSFGISLVEMYTGSHPFRGLDNGTIVAHLIARDLDLSSIDDDRWRLLCSGLLDLDRDTRWGAREVERWLAGESPRVHRRHSAAVPYAFGTEEFQTRVSLLAAMSLDWDRAVEVVRGKLAFQQLCEWMVALAPGDGALATELDSIGTESDPDLRIVRLLKLEAALPPVFRGFSVGGDGLARLAAAAVAAGPGSREANAVNAAFRTRALTTIGSDSARIDLDWHDGWSRVEKAMSGHRKLGEDERTVALARLLAGLAAVPEGASLRHQAVEAARRSPGSSIDWFKAGSRDASSDTPVALATLLLEPTAAAEARAVEAKRRADRDARLRAEREDATGRYPRTRRCLGWSLIPLALLAIGSIAARIVSIEAPSFYEGPTDSGRIRAIDVLLYPSGLPDNEWVEFLRPFLVNLTSPLWILLLLAAGITLWVRARPVGAEESLVTRSPWERRAMQAVIVGCCVVIPLMAPIAIVGAYRGIYSHEDADPHAMRPFRIALNVAGVGYLLHAASVVVVRSPQLSEWLLAYPQWFDEPRRQIPPEFFGLTNDTWGIPFPSLLLVVAGVASLVFATRTLRPMQRWEVWVSALLIPLGLLSLVPGVVIVGFYPVVALGVAVAVVAGAILAVVVIVLVLGAILSDL